MANYDYIVVGARSAGSAVAARLSEDAGIHEAVLEAGSRQVPPRVHGIEGLRLADASVMPAVPPGNCHAGVVMVAGKCADPVTAARARPDVANRRWQRRTPHA